MRSSRAPRVARGVVVASVATFAALLSHVVAGGDIPGWVGIAAPWMLAVMVSTLLAGRGLSRLRLAVSVIVSQLLFHTLFVMGAVSTSASGSVTAGHQHHTGMPVIPSSGDSTVAALCADPAMWVGHGIAAAVTIAVLYQGERTLRALLALGHRLRAWARRVVTCDVIPALPVTRPAGIADAPGWIVRPAARLSLHRHRGPPLSIAL
ncbi:MAG: hypothetical protein J0I43_03510 [Microbacterium sp.]|uniref:hypothetical protein n=1 Tax=Microbacterium sp. TaxID=51671 RepID=UPI001AC57179|nr:hypothetical protein [Microbacterium sp.]MBN9176421.1 hypothetical protein [Microbacterium sp.]